MIGNDLSNYNISFIISCKRNNLNLPSELYQNIISFVKQEYVDTINRKFLVSYINKMVLYNYKNEQYIDDVDSFTIYLDSIPYHKMITIEKVQRMIIKHFQGKIHKYTFAYFCNNKREIVYKLCNQYNHFCI